MINRKEILNYLVDNYDTWGAVRTFFSELESFTPVNGWFPSYDGPNVSDFYLTDEDPRGDQSGQIINQDHFIKLQSFKDGVFACGTGEPTATILAENNGYYEQ